MAELDHSEKATGEKSHPWQDTPDFIHEVMQAQKAITTPHTISTVPLSSREAIEDNMRPKTAIDGNYMYTSALTGAAIGGTENFLRNSALIQGSNLPPALLEHLTPTGTSLSSDIAAGAAKGALIGALSLGAGYAVDAVGSQVFGYRQPENHGALATVIDGLAVPGIVMSNMPGRFKVLMGGGLFLASHVSTALSGSLPYEQVSGILRPNGVDAVGVTAAAMAPLDGKTKALAVGGAWLAGRAYNAIGDLVGLNENQPEKIRSEANDSLVKDMSTRSLASFNDAVAKEKALGKEYEPALELQMKDWLDSNAYMTEHNGNPNPVSSLRNTAILADALGEAKLENGVRLDPADHGPRILDGYNYDFGGEATQFLRMAAGSLVRAENEVELNKGKVIDGTLMDDSYSKQLKTIQADVEHKLDTIYGAHDISGIFADLEASAYLKPGDLARSVLRISQQLEVTKSLDPNFLAKQYRDLALGDFVIASKHAKYQDYSGAAVVYREGAKSLQKSIDLVGATTADNVGLTKIQNEVAKNIPAVIDQALDEFNKNHNK